MTDGGGGISTGGVVGPVDWSYSSPHFNSKDFLHNDSYFDDDQEDDDDLDSYYMDLPPIDMTERLKEVNRALAEDATPVEGNRVTKLRFREIIADFQSPRESVIASDSDDGYGDSSDIMFDAEDENDILCSSQPPLKSGTDQSLLSHIQPSTTLQSSSEELKPFTSNFHAVSSTSSSITTKSNAFEGTKPILKQDPAEVVEKLPITNIEEVPEVVEEIPASENRRDSSFEDVFLPSASLASDLSSIKKDSPSKLFSKSNGRFSKSYRKSELSELESDIDEEIEDFRNDFFLKKDSDEEENLTPRVNSPSPEFQGFHSSSIVGTKVKHKSSSSPKIGLSKDRNSITIDISQSHLLPKPYGQESPPSPKKEEKVQSKPIEVPRGRKQKKISSPVKTSSPVEKPKISSRTRDQRLSSSQPIPNIKSNLMTPSSYQPLKNTRGTILPSNSMRRTKSQTIYSVTKSPLTAPIQATRTQTARKGSPLPRRSSKISEKKPMKAIHNQEIVPNPRIYSTLPKAMMHGVRKAASTSDLRRGGFEEHQKLNDDIYEQWLQEKRKKWTLVKRQEEESREQQQTQASVKLKERKKMAEDAFQQWLRRKREQLRAEKKLRSHQRKIDQHSSYARTRNQCEDAYAEWCKRKQEEMAHRRVHGVNVRSRSLERTWIQEKTRKLYNAYMTK